jgi:hypothetical protein
MLVRYFAQFIERFAETAVIAQLLGSDHVMQVAMLG